MKPMILAALLAAAPALAQESPPALPDPTGPHPVGVVDLLWTDEARAETATPESDDRRRVGARVWYPASSAGGPRAVYMPDHAATMDGIAGGDERLVALVRPLASVATHAAPGAPVASGGPFPVALVSPGGNVSHLWYQALAQDLASHGWIVAAIAHPYSGLVVVDGSLVESIDWGLDVDDPAAARENDDRMSDLLAADAASVLDRLIELGAPGGALAGAVDADRVGIVGHSRGGSTVGRACATDPRMDACVVMDNIGPDREAASGLPKPHLAIRSPWSEGRVARLRAYLGANAVEAWDAEVEGAHHFTFTDLGLLGFPAPPEAIEPGRGHRVTAELVRAFLDLHVRGSGGSFDEAAGRLPEVTAHRAAGP